MVLKIILPPKVCMYLHVHTWAVIFFPISDFRPGPGPGDHSMWLTSNPGKN